MFVALGWEYNVGLLSLVCGEIRGEKSGEGGERRFGHFSDERDCSTNLSIVKLYFYVQVGFSEMRVLWV